MRLSRFAGRACVVSYFKMRERQLSFPETGKQYDSRFCGFSGRSAFVGDGICPDLQLEFSVQHSGSGFRENDKIELYYFDLDAHEISEC